MNIQIYISTTTEEKLSDIRKKYHVSLSTIAQVLTDLTKEFFVKYDNEFFTTYLDKEHRNRTYIKPRNANYDNEFFKILNCSPVTASHVYSNMLYYLANENYLKMCASANKNIINMTKKEIEKQLTAKREIYWNYNNNIRATVRTLRKNKEYFSKILGAM